MLIPSSETFFILFAGEDLTRSVAMQFTGLVTIIKYLILTLTKQIQTFNARIYVPISSITKRSKRFIVSITMNNIFKSINYAYIVHIFNVSLRGYVVFLWHKNGLPIFILLCWSFGSLVQTANKVKFLYSSVQCPDI